MLTNVRAARLVTLTGPGGVGKARMTIEASGRLGAAAWFVPLAPVTVAEGQDGLARMAEARVVCAITADGTSWEIDMVGPALAAAVADLRAGTAPHSARTGGRGACAAGARALYGACAVRSAWRAQRKGRHGDSGLAAVWPGRWSLSAEATGRVEWVDVRRG